MNFQHLILASNYRAHVAIIQLRIMGRSPSTMRGQAHYSLWLLNNLARLRDDWRRFCVRHPFRIGSGDDEKDFNGFCHAEYERK